MSNTIKSITARFFNFPQIDTDWAVWLVMDGADYELHNFNIGFGQAVDFKGQPQDEVRGGRILMTFSQALPESMYQWAMTAMQKSGTIVFRSKTANAPLKIEFTNAFCVNFTRTVDQHMGIITNMIISPEEVAVNDIYFENHWVR